MHLSILGIVFFRKFRNTTGWKNITPPARFGFLLLLYHLRGQWTNTTEAEREKRLLALLEIRPEPAQDSVGCEAIYALDAPDRYIYRRLPDDPPGTPRFEYDVPQTILDSMSTRGLLETGLGH